MITRFWFAGCGIEGPSFTATRGARDPDIARQPSAWVSLTLDRGPDTRYLTTLTARVYLPWLPKPPTIARGSSLDLRGPGHSPRSREDGAGDRGAAGAGTSRCVIVGTGQHYDWQMMGSFLEGFEPRGRSPAHARAPRSARAASSRSSRGLGALFAAHSPSLVLAQGDTTTVIAAAFAARKSGIGVRSRRGRPARVLARAARGGASDLRRRDGRSAVRADPHRGREPHARARQRPDHPRPATPCSMRCARTRRTCRDASATASSSRCTARRRSTIPTSSPQVLVGARPARREHTGAVAASTRARVAKVARGRARASPRSSTSRAASATPSSSPCSRARSS